MRGVEKDKSKSPNGDVVEDHSIKLLTFDRMSGHELEGGRVQKKFNNKYAQMHNCDAACEARARGSRFSVRKKCHTGQKRQTLANARLFSIAEGKGKTLALVEEYMDEKVDQSEDIFLERQFGLKAIEFHGRRWY
ncbi:hypothetical protein HAX54_050511 [Datura stramonium]|uniref:Uncharacterized protein n=1 Tax=Datura stramonium TaxID=4076 RepID=A0ABS8SYJ7_DATST|nr:hypothetical protein [Datura stramonium]